MLNRQFPKAEDYGFLVENPSVNVASGTKQALLFLQDYHGGG